MHARAEIDLENLPIAAVGPLVDAVFDAFGAKAHVLTADRASVTLRVAHIGGPKMRATLYACLAREVEFKAPGRYIVQLISLTTSEARIRIELATTEAA